VAWNPGYSTSTNHYTCAGCTYDASGNVTGDSFNTYAWDPYDKLLGVNSTACGTNGECATYDAFGRMVEFSKDATYKENWYTQAGRVTMSGATLSEAYLGAPGGGTFMELGGQNDYLHKDWLGSARIGELISEQTVGVDLAYAPYGEVYNFIAGAGGDWMFTGDVTQLDSEYLFDTPNREFAAKNQGRWLSPDPAGTGWNQYAYATNPNSNIDPSGLACYPLEKQLFGTCAGFLNNGVSFGQSWNEFSLLNVLNPYEGSDEHIYFFVSLDLVDLFSGGAANNGTNCAPLTPGCSNVPTALQVKQFVQQQCLGQFNNSSLGGAVNFMSMASPVIGPNPLGSTIEDVGGTTLKYGVYQFFNSASQSMAGTPFGSMSGIAAEGIETIAKDVLPVAVGATGLQVIAHAGCATVGGQAAGQMNPLPPGIQF
jgi:RHS repeat-associated protein